MKTNFIKTLFVTLFLLSVNIVNAHDFEVDGIYYKITDATNKTVAVTYKGVEYYSYSNEYIGSVVIPESVSYNGKVYSVTSIGYGAFNSCSGLTSIVIPNSVTSIGESAFSACSGLTSIEIPNSITSIGIYAFSRNDGLTSITIPNSVTSIGDYAFSACSGLTSIVIEVGNEKYDSRENCNAIIETENNTLIAGCKGTTIPNSVTSIGYYAFSGCSGLASIIISNSVTSIGNGAFIGCSGLKSIVIGNSVTSIEYDAFEGCSNLKAVINLSNLTFSKGSFGYGYVAYYADKVINDPKATFVGDFVFSTVDGKHTLAGYLGNETEITLPDNYNGENYVIGNDVFKGCSGLTSITIPNSVTSIGGSAFYDCSNLKTVINLSNLTFSKGSSDYGYVACYADRVINDSNATFIDDYVFSIIDDKHTLVAYFGDATDVTLPGNYNGENYVIGADAFKGMKTITGIVIPNSITSIGESAFEDCSGLTSIEFNATNCISIGSSNYPAFKGCKSLSIVTIGENVKNIPAYAFYGCSGLTSITIPNSVTSIGSSAFNGCSGLTSIVIPNSVTSIGNDAFNECTGLTSVVIGNSVTSIGNDAFYGCKGLTSIVIPNGVTSIGESAFSDCSGLTSIIIGNSVTSIGDYAFDGCSGLTSIEFNATNCTSIGSSNYPAFKGCKSLSIVTIGENVKNIPAYAFYGCSNLKTVINLSNLTFSKSSSGYGYVAYYADKVINAPNGGTIGDFVFSTVDDKHTLVAYFGDATDVTLPGNYNGENYAIGDNVFKNNSSITSIEIPNSVTYIGGHAFYGCSGITNITIPNSVTSIGYSAFEGCKSLASIEIPNSVTSIGDSAFEGCSSLASIVIPNSVTSIGNSAFKGCNNIKFLEINTASVGTMFRDMKSLRKLVIGNDIENIPDNAFNGCSNLSSVTVGSKIKEIKSYSFNGCNNIAKVFWLTNTPPTGYEYLFGKINYVSNNKYTKLENKVVTQFLSSNFEIDGIVYIPTSLADRKCCVADYNPGVNNRGVSIPSTVTYQGVELIVGDIMPHAFYKNELAEAMALENKGMVGESAFEGCNNLARVEIPQSITRIEDYAFRNCTALTDAFFFDRETQLPLGAQLFAECPLDTLYLGAKIEYISEASESTSPFSGNKSLKTVIITDVETDIYDYEFYGCSGLEMAVVGDGVERIGRWTFSGCSSLKNFTFGSNVSTIGEEAFSDCTAVTNITGRAVQPPVCGAQALDDINKWNCTLSVPSQNGNSYKTAEQWKEFVKIENFVTTDNYVTYILEGEVYKTLLLTPGKRIIAPYVANKEDAPFAGWDLNEYMQDVTIDGPTKIETETITEKITLRYPVMPDRDIIVYGWYAGKEYTITYIVDGEVFATDSIAFGSEITLREQPTKEGYTFSGWSEAPTTMPAKDITIEGTFILDNTAIDDIEFENKEITVYDLNGIRVHDTENITRGIYIINGKKVLVK